LRQHFRAKDNLDKAKTFTVEIAYLDGVEDRITVPAFPPTVQQIPWYFHLFAIIAYLLSCVLLAGGLGLVVSIKLSQVLVPFRVS
jgi:hypothetical protein